MQNIHLILLQQSIDVRYLVIMFSKRPQMLSVGFLAVSVRSWGAKLPEFYGIALSYWQYVYCIVGIC